MLKDVILIVNSVVTIWLFILFVSIYRCKDSPLKQIPNLKRAILLLIAFSCIFSASIFFAVFLSNKIPVSTFFLRLSWISAFCVTSYFYLVTVFDRDKKYTPIVIIQYIIAAIITISAFTPLGITKVYSVYPGVRESGIMDLIFRIWIITTLFYSIYLVYKLYRSNNSDEHKKEYFKYFMMSLLFYVFVALIFGAMLPLFGITTYSYLVPVGALVWIISMLFFMKKQFLLNVEKFYYEILFYSVFLSVIVISHYLILNFLFNIIKLSYVTSCRTSLIILVLIFFSTSILYKAEKFLGSIIFSKKVKYQKLIQETARSIVEILDFDRMLQFVLDRIQQTFGVSKIAIFLLDKDNNKNESEQSYKLVSGKGFTKPDLLYFNNRKIIRWLEKNKEPFMLDIAMHTLEKDKFKEFTEGLNIFGAVVIIPIFYNEKLIGILTMDDRKGDGELFSIDEIEIIKSLSDQLAIAIQNSCLYKELDMSYLQIIRALSLTLESKESYLIGHTDDVVKYAAILARELGLSQKEIFVITQAAILHDLGKIAIHDYILAKPDKLTETEWQEIKQHPIKGAKILEALPFLKDVAEIVKHHHEYYNGNGYPEGLKADEIPYGARILSIADAVDSMLSDRPYRKKMSVREVIEELQKNKGKQFDPVLVEKFLDLIKENPTMILGLDTE